jgi:porin
MLKVTIFSIFSFHFLIFNSLFSKNICNIYKNDSQIYPENSIAFSQLPKHSISQNGDDDAVSENAANQHNNEFTEDNLKNISPNFSDDEYGEQSLPKELKKATGCWNGLRKQLEDDGVSVSSTLSLDNTFSLGGGLSPTKKYGDGQYLYFLGLHFDLGKSFIKNEGGAFFIEMATKGGINPTWQSVGSFNFVDSIEAPSGTELYSCWYKYTFKNNASLLIGKVDAYDYFCITPHSNYFFNAGYENLNTIEIFPTYPNPAMAIIGYLPLNDHIAFTLGLFDGSLAAGYQTGTESVFGKFFDHLDEHALIIGEWDFSWSVGSGLDGILGLGGWYNSASFLRFDGSYQRGLGGPYVSLDQVFYNKCNEIAALFFIFGYTDPRVSISQYYYGTGIAWQGFSKIYPSDGLGAGFSKTFFTNVPEAGYIKGFETAYEIYYKHNITTSIYISPNFQWIQNPGGQGLPNASVITLRIFLDL